MEKDYAKKWAVLAYVRTILSYRSMLTIVLVSFCFFQNPVHALDTSMNNHVSLSVKDEPVKNVLHRLEEQTGYKFFYLDRQVDVQRKVTLTIVEAPLESVLQKLFANTATTYSVNGKQIVLKKIKKPDTSSFNINIPDVPIDIQQFSGNTRSEVSTYLDFTVSGKVVAESGESLPGVNVIVEGTTRGSTTDVDGNYSITTPDENVVLLFSFIGYKSQSVNVQGRSVINITLLADVTTLDDVVVIGYGTTSKRTLTGAVTTVKGNDLVSFKAPSVDAMLQGQGTGVQVNQATGVPGGPIRVMVRGTSSISSSTEPLWVIDGLPLNPELSIGGASRGVIPQNPLASINPNDIESIEVLKDASATAIYGSRGSNGVVIVTTKSGKGSKGSIAFDATYGVTEPTKKPSEMGFANTDQWLAIANRARQNSGIATDVTVDLNANPAITDWGPDRLDLQNLGNYSPFDEILRTGSFQEYNLSASQGFEKGSIYISGNYRKDEGVLKNNDFDRLSFRINGEYEPVKNFTLGTRLTLSHTRNMRALDGGEPCCNDVVAAGGFSEAANRALPFMPFYNADGSYFNPASGANLAATTNRDLFKDEFLVYRSLASVYGEYKLPFVEGLSVRTELSADLNNSNRLFWASQTLRPSGLNYAENATGFNQNINYNLLAKFTRTLADNHKVNVVAGTESQRFSGRSTNISGQAIPGRNQDIGSPTIVRSPSGGFGGEQYRRGYFGRADYTFKDRYIIGGSFRRDGVSIFREDFRYSNFAALSLGWIFSEEAFMNTINALSFGKIRASFGQTGNSNIDLNATFPGSAPWPRYGSADGAQLWNSIGVTDLTWETTNSYDAALDLGFFNDRVSISAGYYRQDVNRLLFQVPVAQSVGLFEGSNIWANVADLRNQGFEFSLTTVNIERSGFRWNTSFNITTNKNKVISIIPSLDESGNGLVTGITRNIAGRPLSTLFLAEYAGVDRATGTPMIYEIDRVLFAETGRTELTGNVIPASRDNLQNHRVLQDKTGLPTFFGGITNTLQYKGFELTALLTFQGGNYLYNQAEITAMQVGLGRSNLFNDLIENSWTPENPDAAYPMLVWNGRMYLNNDGNPQFNADGTFNFNQRYDDNTANNRASTRHLYKGDFMRLRTLQLAYTLSPEFISRIGLKGARIFVNGNNLVTFTSFPGWDPEQLNFSGNAATRNLSQGVVGDRLPQLKSFAAGFSITF